MWFEQVVKPRLQGRAFLVRYADDLVLGFAGAEDARRVRDVLPKRFGKYGRTSHPEKTRLVPLVRPPSRPAAPGRPVVPAPGSFDFLGFTHFGSRSKQGPWVMKRTTAGSRLRRAVRRIAAWCRRNRHRPTGEQYQALWRKRRGHFPYDGGVIGNNRLLWCFRGRVQEIWRKWRSRRSGKARLSWVQRNTLLQRYVLPTPPGWVPPCVVNP